MKEGRVAEYGECQDYSRDSPEHQFAPDRPRTLLHNPESEFFKLCATHGTEELEKLKRLAGL